MRLLDSSQYVVFIEGCLKQQSEFQQHNILPSISYGVSYCVCDFDFAAERA